MTILAPAAGTVASGEGRSSVEAASRAFYTGLAALEMGLFERARADLETAAGLLPREPAVVVNLGVLAMRRGDDTAARAHFEQARALAPENPEIELLVGLVARRSGRTAVAFESLRRAVELDPDALKPRYMLATLLRERGDAESDRAAIELIEGMLADAPDNAALRLQQLGLLADIGDVEALERAVDALAPLAGDWPEAARSRLQALEESAGEPEQAAVEATMLRNVLLRTDQFRDALSRIQVPAQLGGEPLEHFLSTPTPPAEPAEPDEALSYRPVAWTSEAPDAEGILVLPVGGPGAIISTVREDRHTDPAFPALSGPLAANQSTAVDLDNDGAMEVVTATREGLRLFRREPDGDFRILDAQVARPVMEAAYRGVWPADLELDGDMDLVLGAEQGPPIVLQNNGDGSFTRRAVFEEVNALRDFLWADLGGDGLPDVAALDAGGRVHRFHNDRTWKYRKTGTVDGKHAAITAADLSRDGRMELVTLSTGGVLASWQDETMNERGHWSDMPAAPAAGEAALLEADLDNNGALDLVATTGGQSAIWLTDAHGRQQRLGQSRPWRVAAIRDLNGDGRLDMVGLDAAEEVVLLEGSGAKSYGWQAIRPRALDNAGDNRINSYALGGQVEIRAGLLVQRRVIDRPALHFGLGERERADVAWILWPNGTSQAEFDLTPRRAVETVQRLKGSCPWVFAHDGEGLRFITDFLWRSPLGMRVNATETATIMQTEDRIRIPGEALARIDGQYEIRITAELWETHFIDGVSLLAVDHPPDTAMFVDERFSRAPPSFDPVLTGQPRPVLRAQDQRGTDWTSAARALDGHYVAGLELGRYQGIARPHYLEIDLPAPSDNTGEQVLLASGWVYPTDSSINVAVAQGASVRPRGLRLEAPDGRGGWEVVRPDLGFPAGKHKTMVIDLEGVFRPGAPRKLRLATNLEIYWDRLAVAERHDPPPAPEVLALETSTLRYRGFSETSRPRRHVPEVPHYDRLRGAGQIWPDLAGYHTRFGDVRELLASPDDRYVIVNAGDELVLRFDAPPVPPGRQRDFILVGHGWVKDGDYNTAFSQTVLPLPSLKRPAYDEPPTTLEDDPVYQRHADDWREYHTRYVAPARFLSGLRKP